MKRQQILRDNKGASLVMVLVAMFFVGLIAAIALTITVGNTKSTKATIKTSENFYSSESVLDDLKMYLKKIATSAATEAYGKTLAEFSSQPEKILSEYRKSFKSELISALTGTDGVLTQHIDGIEAGDKKILDPEFVKSQISFDRPGTIVIKYITCATAGDNAELQGVEIIYTDEKGYETKLSANISFRAQLPTTSTDPFLGSFDDEIDHFVMISGGSINPTNATISGNYIGGVYAKGKFNVKTKTPITDSTCAETDWINLRSHYVLVGDDISVKGRLSITPIADKLIINKGSTKIGSEVWCDNMYLNATDSTVRTDRQLNPDAAEGTTDYLNTDVYLKGNLELNGSASDYAAVGGSLTAYSDGGVVSSNGTKPESSAIILNGLGAKLDLSRLGSLAIAGKAYTELPNLDGVNAAYKYYNGESEVYPTKISYFTQGESVTYRAIQSLYLIPGDYINGVGHNPMKKSEFSSITSANIVAPKDVFGDESSSNFKLKANKFISHEIRYLNGENYVYLFWDFKSTDDAVSYFNDIAKKVLAYNYNTRPGVGRYYDLVLKQIGMLGKNDGYIKLPTSISSTGNVIKYDPSATEKFSKAVANATDIDDKSGDFSSLITAFDPETIFEGFTEKSGEAYTHVAATRVYDGPIRGPLNYKDKAGVQHSSSNVVGPANAKTTTYHLKTGSNISLTGAFDPSDTYIIITPGNVTFAAGCSGTFRGLIIAGGNITLPAKMNMECLGMLKYTEDVNGVETEVDTTELQALLSVKYDDSDTTNGNTILREIFGLRDTSLNLGEEYDGELVKMDIKEYVIN